MADLKDFHLAEIKKWHDRAQALLDLAEHEVRDNTEDELKQYEGMMNRIKEHQTEVERYEEREARRAQLEALGTVTEIASSTPVEVKAKSAGEAFVNSAEYKAIVEAARGDGGFPRFSTPEIEMKAAGDPVLESTGSNADAIQPQWFGLETPSLVQFPVRIQSVMNIVNLTTGNTANYPIVTTRTLADQTDTAESENKAGAEFAFDFAQETVKKWTAFSAASEEMFQDAPTLTNYINSELGVMAMQKEEKAIADALYLATTTAADGSGIQSGSQTAIGYDAVLEAMTLIRIAGGVPNAILINPNDWARLAVVRSVAGDGSYFSGGPYSAPREGIWGGLTEVQTPVIPEGTALVGDFNRGARLFRKGGLRVDSSNSHDTYFRRNLVAIRAEIRSVTGVTYPEFFVETSLGS